MKHLIKLTESELKSMINSVVRESIANKRKKIMDESRRNSTVKLTESQLRRMISIAVNEALDEVKIDGVSLHGNNPYDWKDLSDIRYKQFGKDFNNDKAYNAARRNLKNAKSLGYEDGDTRLAGAQRAMEQGDNKRANELLGDVEGRADRNLRMMKGQTY